MKRKPRPALDPADVDVAFTGFASSPRGGKRRRLSRALDLRAITVTVRHRATGIALQGMIPAGHYTKDEMRKLREAAVEELTHELEKAVAGHLRVRGRSS